MSRLGKIIYQLKSIYNRIKAYLLRQEWKEALIFFYFFLLSLGFWILQSLQQEYEIELKIPIKYSNIPPDIVFSVEEPHYITSRVKDKGSVLLNYTFRRSFLPIDINWKKNETNHQALILENNEIESAIQKQLIATTSLIKFEPFRISLPYSKREKKLVSVRFNGSIKTDAGFKISNEIKIEPAQIEVYAGQSILDTIDYVQTSYLDFQNIKKNIVKEIALQPIKRAKLSPSKVSITIPVEEFIEKSLTIPIKCTDVPEDFKLRTFPSSVKIYCNLPISRFKQITENDFSINIPFSLFEENSSGILPLYLDKKPMWVDTVKMVPNKIEFIIERHSND